MSYRKKHRNWVVPIVTTILALAPSAHASDAENRYETQDPRLEYALGVYHQKGLLDETHVLDSYTGVCVYGEPLTVRSGRTTYSLKLDKICLPAGEVFPLTFEVKYLGKTTWQFKDGNLDVKLNEDAMFSEDGCKKSGKKKDVETWTKLAKNSKHKKRILRDRAMCEREYNKHLNRFIGLLKKQR